MQRELTNSIKSGTKIIQIISFETLRIQAALIESSKELSRSLLVWDRVVGIQKWDREQKIFKVLEEGQNPATILNYFIEELENNSILLLQDFYPDLTEDKP
ncbi:MAG: hypothetical protein JJT94_06840, partial [Bernardetiaceae bacterium]|nr:hypothetical protein [Bernardetiaceae bacterium]